jgi:hypothetical protein
VPHEAPPLGSWARSDGFVGLVARNDGQHVTLLDPGGRQQREVPVDLVQAVPAAAVEVTMAVELPVPHGLDETSLRRWMALLADPVLRDRAVEAMSGAGLDAGAALPQVTLDARALSDGQARCLCGATTPTAAGVAVTCGACGRQAAPPIAPPAEAPVSPTPAPRSDRPDAPAREYERPE